MIAVKELRKNFKTFHALKGIELHVRRGEIYGFIGRNGAGKSTTMNILAGLSRPTSGECTVNGKDIRSIKHPSELHIGYLPEDPKFYPWMSAHETLHYLGNSAAHSVDKTRVDEVLGWVGLEDAARRRVGGFSRGMKQRLGIAAALIHDPGLLILDEPSSALDPQGRSDVLRLIKELKQMGKTVIFSTHILSDVERVCDTVGMIVSGKMLLEKPLGELQKNAAASVFDITLQTPVDQEVISKLKQAEGVTNATVNDGTLSVTVKDAAEGSKELMRFLSGQNIAVQGLLLRRNGLEDIFLEEAGIK